MGLLCFISAIFHRSYVPPRERDISFLRALTSFFRLQICNANTWAPVVLEATGLAAG